MISSTDPITEGRRLSAAGVGRIPLWATGFVIAVCSSCSHRDQWERVVVTGRVTLRSQPVEMGRIRFEPMGGTAGPVAVAIIENGTYRYDRLGGVPVGTHRVRIYGSDPDKPGGGGPGGPPPKELIPPEYNSYSELVVQLERGKSSAVRDFDLE